MPTIRIDQPIGVKPAAAFASFADIPATEELIEAITSIEPLTEGEVRLGYRFRETRTVFGKPRAEVFEVTAFEPPGRLELVCESCGCRYTGRYTFEPASDGGTLLRFEMAAEALTLPARLMAPIGLLAARSMRKAIVADIAAVARAAETDHITNA